MLSTGKSLSEALLFAEHGENMLCTEIVLNVQKISVQNMFSPCSVLGIFMYWTWNSINNLSTYCGLVDAKIRASDKDLPVQKQFLESCWSFLKSWKIFVPFVRLFQFAKMKSICCDWSAIQSLIADIIYIKTDCGNIIIIY